MGRIGENMYKYLFIFILSILNLNLLADTKVLIGSPVHQKPNILKEFLLSLKELDKSNLVVDYYFADDNENSQSKEMLKNFQQEYPLNCLIDINKEKVEHFECNEIMHYWPDQTVWKVAGFKNKMIEYAKDRNYDYLFLIDSDIVLHKNTLKHLIKADKNIISEIHWTNWEPNGPLLPNAWLYDFYTMYEVVPGKNMTPDEIQKSHTEFISRLKVAGIYQVGGLCACTLVSKKALAAGVSFAKIKNLTWWGEDRHFCIRASALGLDLFVDTNYPSYHIYRESYLDGVNDYKETNKYKD